MAHDARDTSETAHFGKEAPLAAALTRLDGYSQRLTLMHERMAVVGGLLGRREVRLRNEAAAVAASRRAWDQERQRRELDALRKAVAGLPAKVAAAAAGLGGGGWGGGGGEGGKGIDEGSGEGGGKRATRLLAAGRLLGRSLLCVRLLLRLLLLLLLQFELGPSHAGVSGQLPRAHGLLYQQRRPDEGAVAAPGDCLPKPRLHQAGRGHLEVRDGRPHVRLHLLLLARPLFALFPFLALLPCPLLGEFPLSPLLFRSPLFL